MTQPQSHINLRLGTVLCIDTNLHKGAYRVTCVKGQRHKRELVVYFEQIKLDQEVTK